MRSLLFAAYLFPLPCWADAGPPARLHETANRFYEAVAQIFECRPVDAWERTLVLGLLEDYADLRLVDRYHLEFEQNSTVRREMIRNIRVGINQAQTADHGCETDIVTRQLERQLGVLNLYPINTQGWIPSVQEMDEQANLGSRYMPLRAVLWFGGKPTDALLASSGLAPYMVRMDF